MKNRLFQLFIILLVIFPYICKADDSRYFYDVLKEAGENGIIAKEYDGNHHDTFIKNRNFSIYHWYANNDTNSDLVLNSNNVIFGNYCWQMIRTTDDGGVKLMYNGIPQNGKCNTDRPNVMGFSYPSSYNISQNYYYGSDYVYNGSNYSLSGDIFSSPVNDNTISNLIGKYTCMKTTNDSYCSDIYLVGEIYDGLTLVLVKITPDKSHYSSIASIPFSYNEFTPSAVGYMSNKKYKYESYTGFMKYSSTTNHNSVSNYKYSYSDSYSIDSNGIVSLINPTVFSIDNFQDYYTNIVNKYICEGTDLSNCNEIRYVTSSNSSSYRYVIGGPLLFNSSFVYENGKYNITQGATEVKSLENPTERAKAEFAHYTCYNSTGICDSLYYIYAYYNPGYQYQYEIHNFLLKNGESIEDIFNNMLRAEDVNKNNSLIKTVVDKWFEKNMLEYTDYLEEDVVFCNDREITAKMALSNSAGSIIRDNQIYKFNKYDHLNDDDLSCSNELDMFNINNDKAKLKYPVGLPDYNELKLWGSDKTRKNGDYYWTITPASFARSLAVYYSFSQSMNVHSDGYFYPCWLEHPKGVRPVVVLKKGATYSSGDGSKDNPYIFDKIYNKIEIVSDETRGEVNVDVEDIRYVDDSTVVFKVMPKNKNTIPKVEVFDIDGNKLSTINTGNTNEYKVDLNGSDITIKVDYNQVISIPNTIKNIGIILLIFIPIIYISIIIINRNKNTDLNRM